MKANYVYIFIFLVLVIGAAVGGISVWQKSRVVKVNFPMSSAPAGKAKELPKEIIDASNKQELLAKVIQGAEEVQSEQNGWENLAQDKEPARVEAPSVVKGIYLNSVAAGRDNVVEQVIELASATELNAVVIDIKDFSGYVFYDSDLALVKEYKAEMVRIKDIRALLQKLHQAGIYAIARIVVFQDPVLASARPDLALRSKTKLASSTDSATSTYSSPFLEREDKEGGENELSSATLWLDNAGLSWVDPSSKDVWQYNIAIAKEAYHLGFDEINFDYVRFPSDGDTKDIVYPVWQEKIAKHQVIAEFFNQLEQELVGIPVSLDIFGYTTIARHDLGVGQMIENSFGLFDYVCPMVYPSHFSIGFLDFENPADEPYEVVKETMESALLRWQNFRTATSSLSQIKRQTKLRPWLQDFDFRADYTAEMIKQEIQGVKDGLSDGYNGFILWNSSSFYTDDVFESN